jgi:hypothetical protein
MKGLSLIMFISIPTPLFVNCCAPRSSPRSHWAAHQVRATHAPMTNPITRLRAATKDGVTRALADAYIELPDIAPDVLLEFFNP